MVEIDERETVNDVLEMIDAKLKGIGTREMMRTDEVSDLLLDIRLVLAADRSLAPSS